MTERSYEEHKDWEEEQAHQASEDAKAMADIEAEGARGMIPLYITKDERANQVREILVEKTG